MKKINISYFLVLFCLTLIYSCSSDLSEDLDITDKTELLKDKIELDEANLNISSSNDFAFASNNNVGGTGGGQGGSIVIVNNAYLKYDKDCDGIFETASNTLTANYTCCWNKVSSMIQYAQLQGWCTDFESELQCLTQNSNLQAICH